MLRKIVVISGLICTGKSRLVEQLGALKGAERFPRVKTISLDTIGVQVWGKDRVLGRAEKVYRNQLAREEVQRLIIVHRMQTIILEMVMLTKANHQEPMVNMVNQTARHLRDIEPEQAELAGDKELISSHIGAVDLKVVLLYCSLERVRQRLERRNQAGGSDSPIVDMTGVYDTAIQFEMPDSYNPLLIDTTDESAEAEAQRLAEIMSFIKGTRMLPPREETNRWGQAWAYLEEMQDEARRAGISTASNTLRPK